MLLFRFCRRPGRFGRNAVSSPKLGAPYGADKRASGWLFGLGLNGGSMFCSRRILRKAGTDQCKNETCCRCYLFHLRFASSPISMLLGRPPKAGEPCQKAEAVTKERGPVCLGDRASHPRAAVRRPRSTLAHTPAGVEPKSRFDRAESSRSCLRDTAAARRLRR